MKMRPEMDVQAICDAVRSLKRYRAALLFGDHDKKTKDKLLEIGDRLGAKVVSVLDDCLDNIDPPLGQFGGKHFFDFAVSTSQTERRPIVLCDVEPLLSTFFGGTKEVVSTFRRLSDSDQPRFPVAIALRSAPIKNAIDFDQERVFQL